MSSPKIVIVTGANSGIGYETVKALLQSEKKYQIFVGARSLDKATSTIESLKKECSESTSNALEPLEVDLTSDESIEKAMEKIKAGPGYLDVLLNNAGATFDIAHIQGKVSLRESFMKAYDVNVAGTHVMTYTFMPLLLRSSDPRLIFVSGLSQITKASEGPYYPTPPQPAGWPKNIDFETIGYRSSKCALNMLMVDWNFKLKADGVKVWAVGPGFLATNLGGVPEKAKEMGAGHPSAGGDILRRIAEGERDDDVGKYVVKNGGILSW
ncbi:hypothetical protein MMC25_006906 [Agyrium rufum]|nr:hypothetical protein [Agyrium rufum]